MDIETLSWVVDCNLDGHLEQGMVSNFEIDGVGERRGESTLGIDRQSCVLYVD